MIIPQFLAKQKETWDKDNYSKHERFFFKKEIENLNNWKLSLQIANNILTSKKTNFKVNIIFSKYPLFRHFFDDFLIYKVNYKPQNPLQNEIDILSIKHNKKTNRDKYLISTYLTDEHNIKEYSFNILQSFNQPCAINQTIGIPISVNKRIAKKFNKLKITNNNYMPNQEEQIKNNIFILLHEYSHIVHFYLLENNKRPTAILPKKYQSKEILDAIEKLFIFDFSHIFIQNICENFADMLSVLLISANKENLISNIDNLILFRNTPLIRNPHNTKNSLSILKNKIDEVMNISDFNNLIEFIKTLSVQGAVELINSNKQILQVSYNDLDIINFFAE